MNHVVLYIRRMEGIHMALCILGISFVKYIQSQRAVRLVVLFVVPQHWHISLVSSQLTVTYLTIVVNRSPEFLNITMHIYQWQKRLSMTIDSVYYGHMLTSCNLKRVWKWNKVVYGLFSVIRKWSDMLQCQYLCCGSFAKSLVGGV